MDPGPFRDDPWLGLRPWTEGGWVWEPGATPGRVYRGGDWCRRAVYCRSAYRFRWHPVYRWVILGFRPALGH